MPEVRQHVQDSGQQKGEQVTKREPLRAIRSKDRARLMWKSPQVESTRRKVLFICTRNSIRSQMAEGFLNHLYGDRYEAFGAGTRPDKVHPLVIDVRAEVGADISRQRFENIEEMLDHYFDVVVTVCDSAREQRPIYPGGAELVHHRFEDPAIVEGPMEERLERFRRVRDEIRAWIMQRFGERAP